MDAPLAILLRDGSHEGVSSTVRLMLKCEQLSVALAKTPIQIPVARSTPILLDLGMTRPTITVSGLVDNVGTASANNAVTTGQYYHMESVSLSALNDAGTADVAKTYYVPYKNYLENKLITWVTGGSQTLQLEVGNAKLPDYPSLTILDGAIGTTGGTSVPVDDASEFIVGIDVKVDSEEMTITAISGNTLTVTRGVNGTTRATHVDNSYVQSVTAATGGGIYEVAVQQCQFSMAPGMEDRWMFSIQFVSKLRAGISF